MPAVRTLLLSLMLMALLPWHAHTAAQWARALAQAEAVLRVSGEQATDTAGEPALLFARKTCRVAGLAGAFCAVEMAVWPDTAIRDRAAGTARFWLSDAWFAESVLAEPLTGPPRFC